MAAFLDRLLGKGAQMRQLNEGRPKLKHGNLECEFRPFDQIYEAPRILIGDGYVRNVSLTVTEGDILRKWLNSIYEGDE